jgi:hypothetical protein
MNVAYVRTAVRAAQNAGIDPQIFLRQINQESGFENVNNSSSGATGIAQFMPETARQYGVDPTDPESSLYAAAQMMRDLLNHNGGDYAKALAAYNAGQGNVDKYGGIPPFSETHQYVSNILGNSTPMTGPQQTSDPTAGMTDEEVLAALGGNTNNNASTAGLPFGYFFDPNTKQIYRSTSNGPVAVSMEEVQQAARYEKQQNARVGAPPNYQMTTDNRTGEGLVFDPRTGALVNTGKQVGFADVNPQEKAQADENQRGFTNAATARNSAIDVLKMAQDRVLNLSRDAEKAQMDRAVLKSDQAKTRATLTEQGREADLRAAVDQYQSALALIPALGQLSLDESKRVQDVLSNGSDYLARAFESQGGTSPLARVTQADQISALHGSLSTLRGMIQDAVAQSPVVKGTGFAGLENVDVGAYQAPNMPNESGLPGLPQFKPTTYTPPATISAPTTAGGAGTTSGVPAQQDVALPPLTGTPAGFNKPAASAVQDISKVPSAGTGANWATEDAMPAAEGWTPQTGANAPYPQDNGLIPSAVRGGAGFLGAIWNGLTQPGSWNQGGSPGQQIPFTPVPAGGYDQMDREAQANPLAGVITPSGAPITWGSPALTPAYTPITPSIGNAAIDPNALSSLGLGGYPAGNPAIANSVGLGDYNPGYARGTGKGFTRVGMGIVGDSKSGKPTGHEEMFVNPTNAPIGILSHDEMTQQMRGFSRYATGTGMDSATDTIVSDPGTGLGGANFGPADVSMGKLDGPNYDWYDPSTGSAGYGAFNPGSADEQPGGVSTPAPTVTSAMASLPRMGAPAAPSVTQAQLADMAVANTPPAIQALFNNQRAAPPTALRSQGTDGGFLRPFTARQLGSLSKEDQGALNTRLLAQYNAPLSYVTDQTARMYGPSRERQSGFLGATFR